MLPIYPFNKYIYWLAAVWVVIRLWNGVVMEPKKIKHLFLIATAARESAWGIAIHTSQRMAIESDASWKQKC